MVSTALTRQLGLLVLQLHSFAHLAGAHQLGLALDDGKQLCHHIEHLLGELARLDRRGDRGPGRCWRGLWLLVHVVPPK
jgi:hypothetical protein